MFWSMSVWICAAVCWSMRAAIRRCHLLRRPLGESACTSSEAIWALIAASICACCSSEICAVGNTGRIRLRGQAHGRKDLRRDLLTDRSP